MASSCKQQLPKCKYGSACYRTNGGHRMEFWHPESLPTSRANAAEEHSLDIGANDGGKIAVFPQPSPQFARNSTLTDAVDDKVECAANRGRGPEVSKWVEKEENNGLSPKDNSTSNDAPPNRTTIAMKADARILLLLIGLPGSGKSTFCAKLMSNAAQPWTRICQDIIAKGKHGTKKECLKHAERALARNSNVVIDRCNFDKAQRLEFLQRATSSGIEAHGVVLDLPASVCIQRASKRTRHEGGVHAGNAGSIINRFASTRQLPSLSEGFSRITFCRTDNDVEKAIQQYRELLPSRPLESGVFGVDLTNSKTALQLVFQKGGSQPHVGGRMDNADEQVEKGREVPQQAQVVDRENTEQMQVAPSPCRIEQSNARDLAGSVSAEDKGSSTLAFPSISTSDFHFDHEKAASVLVEAAAKFLINEDSKMRLVLVDLTHSHMMSLVCRKAKEKCLDSHRFLTFVGDITKLRSSNGPACNIIANAANWRLKAGGGGVNAAIYSAAGPDLELVTKRVAQILNPGSSVVVQLPKSSPLYSDEGVSHVIHVLGPNMNPQRPNCLSGDYFKGCTILQSSYDSLFQNFSSVVRSTLLSETGGKLDGSGLGIVDTKSTYQQPSRNAFTVLMQASKRNRELKDANPKGDKVRVTEEVVARAGRGSENTSHPFNFDTSPSCGLAKSSVQNQPHSNTAEIFTDRSPRSVAQMEGTDTLRKEGLSGTQANQQDDDKGRRWDRWALALYETAMHPEKHKDVVLQLTDDAVVLRDVYPKAQKHLLVVARRPGLDSLDNVRKEHLALLRHMHSLGQEWAATSLKEEPSLSFRIGYHLVPSMRQLHLHVISQDFNSPALKNKKHWNSFTTPFFRDSVDVIDQLERHGQVQVPVKDAENFLDVELRCHRCRSAHPNLPRLKQHISTCRRPFANQSFIITLESLSS